MKLFSFKTSVQVALVSVLLCSCQPPGKSGGENPTVQIQGTGTSGNGSMQGGTDQTGGGNGVNGVALDAFIQPVMNDPTYKKFVVPIIEVLSVKYPRLAADFYHISVNRDWYFIPVDLPQISKNILGTYAPTDQLALQDLNKIWIDKKRYDDMSEQAQGFLLVHEIMMGIRLMKYKERQDRCIAKAALIMISSENLGRAEDLKYKDEKRNCRKIYPTVDGFLNTKFQLNNDDYDLIRKLVSKLMQKNIDTEEIQSLIDAYRYRDYSD